MTSISNPTSINPTLIDRMTGSFGFIIQSSHGIHFAREIEVYKEDIFEILIQFPVYITSPVYDKHHIRMSPEFLAGTDISSFTGEYNWVKSDGKLIITYVYEIANILDEAIAGTYINLENNIPPIA